MSEIDNKIFTLDQHPRITWLFQKKGENKDAHEYTILFDNKKNFVLINFHISKQYMRINSQDFQVEFIKDTNKVELTILKFGELKPLPKSKFKKY